MFPATNTWPIRDGCIMYESVLIQDNIIHIYIYFKLVTYGQFKIYTHHQQYILTTLGARCGCVKFGTNTQQRQKRGQIHQIE